MADENKSIFNLKFWISLIVLSAAARPVHEFGHWIMYKLYGVKAYYTFNQVMPYNLKQIKVLAEAGGPIINAILCILGFYILYKSSRFKEFGLAMIMSNAFLRIIAYIPIALFHLWDSNDEGIIGLLSGSSVYSGYIVFGFIFLLMLYLAYNYINEESDKKVLYFILSVCIFGTIVCCLSLSQQKYEKNYQVNFYELKYFIDQN